MTNANYEDTPPSSVEVPPQNGGAPQNTTPPSQNGTGGNSDRAGLSKIFVGSEDSGYWQLSKELMTASGDFSEVLPRAIWSEQDLAAALDIIAEDDQYDTGWIEPSRVVWLKAVGGPGINGQAREQAIRAETGGQGWRAALKSPFETMGKFFGGGGQNKGAGNREGPNG